MTDATITVEITRSYHFGTCADKWVMAGQRLRAVRADDLPPGWVRVPALETYTGRTVAAELPPGVWREVE